MYGQSAGQTASPYASGVGSGYPINVEFPRQASYNQFWAIPVVGNFVKSIILIPHIIILAVLVFVVELMQLVIWISVLSSGKYPDWGYNFVGGTLRWAIRVNAFNFGLSDQYPSFSMQDTGTGTEATVTFQVAESNNKLWAIPVVGLLIKEIILIPHFICLAVLTFVVRLLQLVTWIPVLFGGQYPDWGMSLVGGTLRWATRVFAYLLGLTDVYPPFQLAA
jgi:hypothetical protein